LSQLTSYAEEDGIVLPEWQGASQRRFQHRLADGLSFASPLAYARSMKSDIQNYLKLQTALLNEKSKLEARLNAIN